MPSQAGGRTFFDREQGEAPFTDAERAQAGMPPYQPKKGPSGTSRASFLKDLHDADEEAARQHGATPGGETRVPSTKVDTIKKGASKASMGLAAARVGAHGTAKVARATGQAASTTASDTADLVKGKRPVSITAGVLGLLGYAVAVNFLHGGWPQVKGWLGAKFANQPYTLPASSTTATTLPSTTAKVAPVIQLASVQTSPVIPPVSAGSVA